MVKVIFSCKLVFNRQFLKQFFVLLISMPLFPLGVYLLFSINIPFFVFPVVPLG